MKAALTGTFYVVPTAFDDSGDFDPDSQAEIVEAAVEWGADGLTVMGVMSEVGALTAAERERALQAIFQAVAGRVPVAVGCSGAAVATVIAHAHDAEARGAAAAMVSAPPLLRNTDALPRYFGGVGEGTRIPIVVQDEPTATGTFMPVSVLLRCLDACGATTVKLEDPPTPPKLSRLLAERPGLNVFGGLGGVSALAELSRGACGTMTGFSYPEVLRAMRVALAEGDPDRAAAIFDRWLPLIAYEGQPVIGLAIRKEVLRRRGVLRSARTRGLAQFDDVTARELDHLFGRMSITPSRSTLEVE